MQAKVQRVKIWSMLSKDTQITLLLPQLSASAPLLTCHPMSPSVWHLGAALSTSNHYHAARQQTCGVAWGNSSRGPRASQGSINLSMTSALRFSTAGGA